MRIYHNTNAPTTERILPTTTTTKSATKATSGTHPFDMCTCICVHVYGIHEIMLTLAAARTLVKHVSMCAYTENICVGVSGDLEHVAVALTVWVDVTLQMAG